jgi:hypothetical protein
MFSERERERERERDGHQCPEKVRARKDHMMENHTENYRKKKCGM